MREQPPNRRWLLAFLLVVVVLTISCLSQSCFQKTPVPEPLSASPPGSQKLQTSNADGEVKPPSTPAASEPDHICTWTIATGDNLSAIFNRFEISQGTLCQIVAADEQLLALDILRPDNILTFTLDEKTRQLLKMELYVHPGKRIVYHRVDANSFDYEEILVPGDWYQEVIDGEINGNFFISAINSGLSEQETVIITDLFKEKLNFSRDIRGGDRFQIVRSQEFVEGQFTGQSYIKAVRIIRRHHLHSAFLFEDGNYYDLKGQSLARAFRRYPTQHRFRVSSPFSRTRRHPITGRIAPHNGVDFSLPVGTPVLATGDGRVTRVENHPFAGKYIEIRHGGHYATRYLHLNRILVKRGQSVRRGERIALSGNTGRSTGPHLHFELHVKGRPVNPLKAAIPMLASVPKRKIKQFKQQVAELIALMEHPSRTFALR